MKKTFTLLGFLVSTKAFSHENFSEHQHIEQTLSSSLAAIESLMASQTSINELMVLAMILLSIVSLALIIRKKIIIKD